LQAQGFPKLTYKHTQSQQVQSMQCCVVVSQSWLSCHMCRMVLWSRLQSSCHVRCRGCSHRATFGVAVAVVVPCSVPWSQSLCRIWCHGHCRCAMFSVAVAIVVPHVVSRALSSCHVQCCSCCRRTARGVVVVVGVVELHGVTVAFVAWLQWVLLRGCCTA
jgi:hypothetical protein